MTFTVPGDNSYHNISTTVPLDTGLVNSLWLQENGSRNYGLLLRAVSGRVSLMSSHSASIHVGQKPALRIKYMYSVDSPPTASNTSDYPVDYTGVSRVIWVDSDPAVGHDLTGSGSELYPFSSPKRAIEDAWPGDIIQLRSGVYPGAVVIRRSGITIQSAPGHWAVLASSMHDPTASVNVLTINAGLSNITLRGFEITGSFYYGVMLATSGSSAPRHVLLEDMRIHHTGASCVKASQGSEFVTIRGSELAHCGVRNVKNAHGFVGVRVHVLLLEDNYIHDLPGGAGIHLEAGCVDSLIQRNYVSNVTNGMNIGFSASYNAMDHVGNPESFESLHSTITSNIIAGTRAAGINLWAALDARVQFNTLYHTQEEQQSSIVLSAVTHAGAPGDATTPCRDIIITGNIVQKAGTSRGSVAGEGSALLHIRAGGLEGTAMPSMSFNNYFAQSPILSREAFATFHDERNADSIFFGRLSEWAEHCSCEAGSVDADPLLNQDFALAACSPAATLLPAEEADSLAADFHNRARNESQEGSVGAVALFPAGDGNSDNDLGKSIPPVPVVFAAVPPFSGVGGREAQYEFGNWPYLRWQARECQDLIVNAKSGTDEQTFNLESDYEFPFKTLQQAVNNANQCDRILLMNNKAHLGPVWIGKPNITIMAMPGQGAERPQLKCNGKENCIFVGGNVGGSQAVELTLSGFDVKIKRNSGSADCIRLNAGYGGGSLGWWDFYVENSATGKYSRGHTLIEDMMLLGCRKNGIKLSTFVTDVVIKNTEIRDVFGNGIAIYGGGNVTIQNCSLHDVKRGIVITGGSRDNLIERTIIDNFSKGGIFIGFRGSEVQYSDVDFHTSPAGSWHDATNCIVRNNIIAHGGGPGVAFYSAKNARVGHNTIMGAATEIQGGVMLNLSPRILADTLETLPPNENIIFRNNILTVGLGLNGRSYRPNFLMKTVQGSIVQKTYTPSIRPAAVDGNSSSFTMCEATSSSDTRRLLAAAPAPPLALSSSASSDTTAFAATASHHRRLQSQGFAMDALNAPGTQGRNPDGSCPHFPDSNLLNMRVDDLPVHPRSEIIKIMIGSSNMHAEFGVMHEVNGHSIPYGIPIEIVNTIPPRGSSEPPQPIVPLFIDPVTGYGSESDYPFEAPFPDNTRVQNAYENCPDSICPGDRHSIVLDNSTCTLYETFRTFSPNITGGNWSVVGLAKFNLQNNLLRPLGYTSADAAGLPIHSGLVKFDEVINQGVINHAIRMTGPNSKEAYSFPATHFAPAGDTGVDSPWMGMRVRLKSSFNCSGMARASRVFCTALKEYGAIFCDNGASWDFGGEATDEWVPYKDELHDLTSISPADMEVLDPGCICLDAACVVADCGDGILDPTIPPVFPPIANSSALDLDYNIYHSLGGTGRRFKDNRRGSMGEGYRGDLQGWTEHISGDRHSGFEDPLFLFGSESDSESSPVFPGAAAVQSSSPALDRAPPLDFVTTDFYGQPLAVSNNGRVTVGALV